MSRLGKKPIEVPKDVDINIADGLVRVKGPKGELSRNFKDFVNVEKGEGGAVVLTPAGKSIQFNAYWGTYSSHLLNMIQGVREGFSKNLILEGVGYRAKIEGDKLVMTLGFSHPVEFAIPKGVEIKVEKNIIRISGIDKESVGQTAAVIRSLKKPEPYKGKGIRYESEVVRRKSGKKTGAA